MLDVWTRRDKNRTSHRDRCLGVHGRVHPVPPGANAPSCKRRAGFPGGYLPVSFPRHGAELHGVNCHDQGSVLATVRQRERKADLDSADTGDWRYWVACVRVQICVQAENVGERPVRRCTREAAVACLSAIVRLGRRCFLAADKGLRPHETEGPISRLSCRPFAAQTITRLRWLHGRRIADDFAVGRVWDSPFVDVDSRDARRTLASSQTRYKQRSKYGSR